MRDSDWSRQNLLRSDWLVLIGASYTTEVLSLYSLVFISNRRVFIAQSSYFLINSYPVSGV